MSAPFLHDLVPCVSAPALLLSHPDGQVRPGGVQGWFRGDRRLLSTIVLRVDGREPVGVRAQMRGAAGASFTGVATPGGHGGSDDEPADPALLVDRERVLDDDVLTETFTLRSSTDADLAPEVRLLVGSDLASMAEVRSGRHGTAVAGSASGTGLVWRGAGDDDAGSVEVHCDPAPDAVDAAAGEMRWRPEMRGHGTVVVRLTARVRAQSTVFAAARSRPWHVPEVEADDPRVGALLRQSVDDLGGLLLRDGEDHFVAAGAPWFLTLFGRDSLLAARMLLPLGTDLALSTLRTLARRQGARENHTTEEQPGKILHEVRGEPLRLGSMTLPPVYYGTVDATPLFVVLLAEAWRWGAPAEQVEPLLTAAERCLAWVEEQAGDGFLRYVDRSGHGLANQGWKDSVDSIQWADGRLADPPIALSEVQGYAHLAAVAGADLLEAFGRSGTDRWRAFAARLRDRFRDSFWVGDADGRYPAIALDGSGRAVDGVASNMGHLLGTGLLDAEEARLVADRLSSPSLASGFGLRTLTDASPRYGRLSYHGGTVWPHDTAIAADGLAREGHAEAAASLLRGLLSAAPSFGYRLPELYGGDRREDVAAPTPYPAACRPQAWAAASSVAALSVLLGLDPDLPRGTLRLRSPQAPFGAMHVTGMRLGPHVLDVSVARDGTPVVRCDDDALDVRLG